MSLETLRITFTDGRELDVQPNLFDQMAFERTLRNNKQWGALRDNLMRMSAFRAWSAAKRLGLTDLSWSEFYESENTPIASVLPVTDEDDDDAELEVEGLGKDTPTEPSTTPS